MHFSPVVLDSPFSLEDRQKLIELLRAGSPTKSWKDGASSRLVKKFDELETYFSKKLEPVAREIFGDPTLKTTYSVYLDYNKPTSNLTPHRDTNACTYTINYSVSAKTPWALTVGGKDFNFLPGQALAFMGGFDEHGRGPMPDPENNRVEAVMFHFCPEDHWYFTEGPDYVYYLNDEGLLPDGDSYQASPKYIEKMSKK